MPDEQEANATEPRETDIRLSIRRVYNVGAYESLEVSVESTDRIQWNNLKERQAKTENLTKLLVKKFAESKKIVFNGLAAVEKNATYKNAAASDGDDL